MKTTKFLATVTLLLLLLAMGCNKEETYLYPACPDSLLDWLPQLEVGDTVVYIYTHPPFSPIPPFPSRRNFIKYTVTEFWKSEEYTSKDKKENIGAYMILEVNDNFPDSMLKYEVLYNKHYNYTCVSVSAKGMSGNMYLWTRFHFDNKTKQYFDPDFNIYQVENKEFAGKTYSDAIAIYYKHLEKVYDEEPPYYYSKRYGIINWGLVWDLAVFN